MILRPESERDHAAIRGLLCAAFPTSAEADLVEALRNAGDAIISFVAAEDNRIFGHALPSAVEAPFGALGLGPVAVLPARQAKGLGSRLVGRALQQAGEAGFAAVFVLGDPRFYERFGFSRAAASGFASPYAGPHFMAATLRDPLPVATGRVAYAPAFAALD